MDNLITCEFCGTAYDPALDECPACHRQPENSENYMGDHYDYDERPIEDEPVRRRGGKIAALIALLLLLIGFTGYILYAFELLPFLKPTETPVNSELVACTGLSVDVSELTLTAEGQSARIQAVPEPADTTDRLVFSADDSTVISVSQDGTVVAKAPGEATVTVMCGKYSFECKVTCQFEGEAMYPAPESGQTAETTEPEATAEPLSISEEDISFFEKGESTVLKLTGGDGSTPEWRSEDSSIATVSSSGEVVAIGSGFVVVSATVGDETVECIVRCQFE